MGRGEGEGGRGEWEGGRGGMFVDIQALNEGPMFSPTVHNRIYMLYATEKPFKENHFTLVRVLIINNHKFCFEKSKNNNKCLKICLFYTVCCHLKN